MHINLSELEGEPVVLHLFVGEVTLEQAQRALVEATVRRCKTRKEAAQRLGVCGKTLYNFLRRYAVSDRRKVKLSARELLK